MPPGVPSGSNERAGSIIVKVYRRVLLILALSGLAIGCDSTPEPEAPKAGQVIALFYYNPEMDMDAQGNIQCSAAGLVALSREVSADLEGLALIRATIERLLEDELSAGEIGDGITSDFPLTGLVLEGTTFTGGLLTLTFSDPEFQTSGGACRVSILRAQVEATAMQFDGVAEVRILPEDLFQP